MQNIKRNILNFVLAILFLLDVCYSFQQHCQVKLDGDMAQNIVPSGDYKKVLSDPLAINVIIKKEMYAGPNRFFAHWPMYVYFNSVPFILQKFTNPIDSVYISCALFKTTVQCFIVFLIAFYVFYFFKCRSLSDFLIIVVLIFPFFQTAGYNGYMGIIDRAVTYTFFYAFPLGLTLLFFLPFFRSYYTKGKIELRTIEKVFLVILAVIISLSGPLVPGVVLILCVIVMLSEIISKRKEFKGIKDIVAKISPVLIFYFGMVSLFCMYSLYVGTFNLNNGYGETIPLGERYSRMPSSVIDALTQKPGLPLLLISVIINCILIKRKVKSEEGRKIISVFRLITLFSVIYIFLVPLGGYRMYRPGVLRYDTLMPVTIGLIFMFAASSFFLIRNFKEKIRYAYLIGIFGILLAFTNADERDNSDYLCERNALEQLSYAKDSIIFIKNDCTVMSWSRPADYNETELNAELFLHWGITKEKVLYYQK
jgi:hypothetical protein